MVPTLPAIDIFGEHPNIDRSLFIHVAMFEMFTYVHSEYHVSPWLANADFLGC